MSTGKFSDWSPYTGYVQGGLRDEAFVNSQFTLLAAGPPRLSNFGGGMAASSMLASRAQGASDQIVFPIGGIQGFSLSQSKNFQRIFEIGSQRSYAVAGHAMGQISLGRAWYHGGSLLRVLYAYYQDMIPPTFVPPMFNNIGAQTMANPHDVIIPPGYENLFLNLASDLFSQPVGIMAYITDNNLDTLGAVYFEAVVVPQHSFGLDAQGGVVQEQAGMQYERMVPVQVAGLSLVTGGTEAPPAYPGLPG